MSACIFRMGDGTISWKTKSQTSVALSSVEAEYMAMCRVQRRRPGSLLTGLLENFGLDLWSPMVILGDNRGTPAFTQNPVFPPHSKGIAIQYHFTRELV